MTHTQGPWTTSAVDKRLILSCGTGGAKVAIALDEVDDNPGGPKAVCESYANALVIAAAPELLDALTALLNWGRDHLSPVHNPEAHTLLVAAHNAINKATQCSQGTKERKGQK